MKVKQTANVDSKRDFSVRAQCFTCRSFFTLRVNKDDMVRWRDGELIQRAMPYLTPDERELLISSTCGKCFDKMTEGL